jgi:DNA polymerase III subunit gamma/tau
MAFALADRPQTWDRIVGQDRAVRQLKAELTQARTLPKGLILEGPSGCGKTTTARLLAQALMCIGGNPLGCGTCPSCKVFLDEPAYHPEFLMIDAASNSGVDAARRIVESTLDLPTLGRTRVVIIDEAHRLSQEAWDVYLAPLESENLHCTFIFCTTEGRRIPKTIRGRCGKSQFFRVSVDNLMGLLIHLAESHQISYDSDGIRAIAKAAKGQVRDAVALLEQVARHGKVTREAVATTIDLSLPDQALNTLVHLAYGRFPEACKELQAMALGYGPGRAIEEVFSAYGRTVFGDPDGTAEEDRLYQQLRLYFPNVPELTSTLLKWAATDRVPTDALPLFAHELAQHVACHEKKTPASTPAAPPMRQDPAPAPSPTRISRLELGLGTGAGIPT